MGLNHKIGADRGVGKVDDGQIGMETCSLAGYITQREPRETRWAWETR